VGQVAAFERDGEVEYDEMDAEFAELADGAAFDEYINDLEDHGHGAAAATASRGPGSVASGSGGPGVAVAVAPDDAAVGGADVAVIAGPVDRVAEDPPAPEEPAAVAVYADAPVPKRRRGWAADRDSF
jgi:hypothetical protein